MDDLPWEQSGDVRRDAEPHRGHLLRLLANFSVACGIVSFCTFFPSIVGLLLGLTAFVMARRDLKKMRAGVMDDQGREETENAWGHAFFGVILNFLLMVTLGLFLSFSGFVRFSISPAGWPKVHFGFLNPTVVGQGQGPHLSSGSPNSRSCGASLWHFMHDSIFPTEFTVLPSAVTVPYTQPSSVPGVSGSSLNMMNRPAFSRA